MNKIGTIDIIKAYLGNKELSANNAYIGEISLIKGSGPTPVPVPNDEIWYTSSDSNIVSPHDTTALPTIVSNTYSDGKGVIKFDSDLTIIGDLAFYSCTGLTSVNIPNSVTNVGNMAFDGCKSLTSTNILNIVTSIGDYAFRNCSSLTSITIPDSVTSIGDLAFIGCNSLTSPLYNTYIFVFMPTSYSGAYIIPNSILTIIGGAFTGCVSLTSITIQNNVTNIRDRAFAYISAKVSFTELYSTYVNQIFATPTTNTTYTYNVEFNISEIPTDYNISSMLPQHTGNKGTITYNIYTDYEPCKDQALALANTKTIVNVYHIDGTPWA